MAKYLINVMYDTMDACDDNCYTNEKNQYVEIKYDDITKSIKSTIKVSDVKLTLLAKYIESSNIEVINIDCLDAGLILKTDGYNPVVLNMASMTRPGGGYLTGARAQEESLFRRTNLYQCLNEKMYPLNFSDTIYTPDAIVIKDSKYRYYDNYHKISFVACPAYRLKSPDDFTEYVAKINSEKIKLILNTAIKFGHDSIVLSAFGCGAYHNPPKEIAKIFKKIIIDEKYNYYFKKIVFAIIDDSNAMKHIDGNFKHFKDVFN